MAASSSRRAPSTGRPFAAVAGGRYRVEARRDGYASTELAGVEVEDQPIEDLELVLRPGAEIVGSILGLGFEELSAVEVEAERDARTILAGVVDYEGRYRAADVASGDWRVRARLRGGSREAEIRVAVEPGVERLERDLEFGGGLTLIGQVIYGGEPLPQTWVALRGLEVDVERSVTTDWQGRFRFLDLESGRYRLSLSNAQEVLVHNADFELIEDWNWWWSSSPPA
ncbi:MAG: carboxypeptidase-like regulatory domain-containing protein [Thermoanaerobaculia bacterium]